MALFKALLLTAALTRLSSCHPVVTEDSPAFLAIQTALPTPAPAAAARPPLAGPGQPGSQIKACTSTMSITYSRPACVALPATQTLSEYGATTTVSHLVECGGCLAVEVETSPRRGGCPMLPAPESVTTTTLADATETVYETACSPTTAYADLVHRRDLDAEQEGSGGGLDAAISLPGMALSLGFSAQQACPTTIVVPGVGNGGTTTQFERTVTVTQYVNCQGCQLMVETRIGGLGPIQRPGVTMSAPVGTQTAYVCMS